MSMPPAACGTDGGYFRHRRVTKTEPCDECRAAHAEATRKTKNERRRRGTPASRGPQPWKTCACGKRMASTGEACWRCNKEAKAARKRGDYDPNDDPKCPVAWVRKGYLQVPVYEQSEVA